MDLASLTKEDLMKRKILLLYLPLFVIMIADLLLTLFGLSKNYWSGNYGRAYYEEVSIIGRWLLSIHPYVFIGAFIAYLLLTYFTLEKLGEFWRLTLFFSILLNHSIAAAGWIKIMLNHNFGEEIANTIEIGIFIIFSLFISRFFGFYKNAKE
jgi:hypothetical protein